MEMDEALRQAVDHIAISRLQSAYADVVNRRAWGELSDLFLAEAVVDLDLVTVERREIVGPVALGGFIAAAIERFSFFEFVILNSRIELWPDGDVDKATARVFMCELRQDIDKRERNEVFGLYSDTYLRQGGTWWFAHRRYRTMARFPTGEVFDLL